MAYSPVDHILLVILAVIWPLYAAYVQFPRLKRDVSLGLTNTRVRAYLRAIAIQWSIAASVVLIWVVNNRPFYTLGVAASSVWRLGFGMAVLATAAVLLELQRRRVTGDAALRAEFREKIESAIDALPFTRSRRGASAIAMNRRPTCGLTAILPRLRNMPLPS